MSQLHFYVTDSIEEKLRNRAAAAGKPLSRYLAEVVRLAVSEDEWPADFRAALGGWQGAPLTRAEQGQLESRAAWGE